MKMKLLWKTGNKALSFDEKLGLDVLDFARENPNAEESLLNNLELRGAVYAIIEALPSKIHKHINHDHKVDIASVIILQRATEREKTLVDYWTSDQSQETLKEGYMDSQFNTRAAEEA